jgi:NAD(P)-dependent dehydrogenase (short-subunit alcohol dehydrogenase family)
LYHTTKWGVEGFVETVAQEVAPFNIEFTIVEPGPAKTNFGAGLVSPLPMAIYENTPAGEVRRALVAGTFKVKGDAEKMVQAIFGSVGRSPAPSRLTLGSDAYIRVRAALADRIAALDLQKDIALSTDTDD